MRASVIIVAVAFVLLGPAGAARAADYKDLIVGTWEIVYSDVPASDVPDGIPVGTKLEFTKDGKVNLTVKLKDGTVRSGNFGGYRVEKDLLALTGKEGTKNDKGRIVLLNETSFVINDEVYDKVMVLKKMKK